VLDAIKVAATTCGISAERVDEAESNNRITDRILESIAKAEFVIVDLTNERPNVLFEAGFAHGIGKIPIYVAREGTTIHFDVKDYPVIQFRNMKELKDGVWVNRNGSHLGHDDVDRRRAVICCPRTV
jgi:nucleoside 2-deoxyribosyltransferase